MARTTSSTTPGKKASRLIIGLMSGTSVDGIDAALVRVESISPGRYRPNVVAHAETKWPRRMRERLLAVMAPAETTTQEICELNGAVASCFVDAAFKVAGTSDLRKRRIAAIASHGQTVCHLPPGHIGKSVFPSTLQLGDVSVMATLAGVPVVGNFRPADMAAGGQGAPLIPFADEALLAHDTQARCVQNIGGIANVTYLPALGERGRQVIAFDTGPGNMVMDALISTATKGAKHYDRNGATAARGTLDLPLFRQLQEHVYFSRRPPKSTGREEFGAGFAKRLLVENRQLKIENLLHTVTRLTAWSIADAYLHFLPKMPDEVILCGGGADNPVLRAMLAEELAAVTSEFVGPKQIALRRIDAFGIPNKAKEAAGFALLGAATLDGVPGNLPSVTGASRAVVLGVVAGSGLRL